MEFAIFVICHGILLELLGDGIVVDNLHTRIGNQFDDIQQFTRIATRITEDAVGLLHIDIQATDMCVFVQSTV